MATRRTTPLAEHQPVVETVPAPKQPAAAFATRKKGKSRPKAPANTISAEDIRVRAYYLSLERNGSAGDALADWLAAERELTSAAHEQ